MEKLSERLKELRLVNDLYQKDVAEKVGVVHDSISQYELGDRIPSLKIFLKLCLFFDVSADYLLGLTDDPKRHNDRQAP